MSARRLRQLGLGWATMTARKGAAYEAQGSATTVVFSMNLLAIESGITNRCRQLVQDALLRLLQRLKAYWEAHALHSLWKDQVRRLDHNTDGESRGPDD